MNKKPAIANPKEYLIARDNDRLSLFTLKEAQIRGAYVQANLVVQEMAVNHSLGPYETFLLGQGYVAALLMTSNLKEDDQLQLRVQSNGPAGGFAVESNVRGEVRGYLFQTPLQVPTGTENLSFGQAMGDGFLSISRILDQGRIPSTGTVTYQGGDLAGSLIHYYDQSEQTRTAFDISLHFDRQGNCLGAAGIMLQALPGCSEEDWEQAAQRLSQIPSIGENAAANHAPSALLEFWFSEMAPQLHQSRRVEFFCPCSRERFEKGLKTLSSADRQEILLNGPFPVETRCHHCSSTYLFSRENLEALWKTDSPAD